MALVPNGRVRVMEAQSLTPNRPDQFNVQGVEPTEPQSQSAPVSTPVSTPAPREQIEQEPAANIEDQVQQVEPNEQMAQPESNSAIKPDQGEDDKSGSDLQEAFRRILNSIGVEDYQIKQKLGDIFRETEDLSNGTVKGYYLLPTYTLKGQISKEKVRQIATSLGKKFNLSQQLSNDPVPTSPGVMNWKVTFTSAPKVEVQQGGSSFDSIGGQGGQAKTASTFGEMIKASREELYDKLRNTYGVK